MFHLIVSKDPKSIKIGLLFFNWILKADASIIQYEFLKHLGINLKKLKNPLIDQKLTHMDKLYFLIFRALANNSYFFLY